MRMSRASSASYAVFLLLLLTPATTASSSSEAQHHHQRPLKQRHHRNHLRGHSALAGNSRARTLERVAHLDQQQQAPGEHPSIFDHEETAGEAPSSSSTTHQQQTRVWVEYKNTVGRQHALDEAKTMYEEVEKDHVVVMDVDGAGASALELDENIVTVEEDYEFWEQGYLERYVTPDEHRRLKKRDQDEIIPYGIAQIQGDKVHVGEHNVTVCIIDTGLNVEHPDLSDQKITGIDRGDMVWSQDVRGHGTHLGGILAATCENGIGICGMAGGEINTLMIRGLSDKGNGHESDVYDSLQLCRDSGARVISLSLGGRRMSPRLHALIDDLYVEGRLMFSAAGNDGSDVRQFPAAHPKVVSVAAATRFYRRAELSNTGGVELAAAGHHVLSTGTFPNGTFTYAFRSGTSMSTPHVSGAAAILWSHYPDCTNTQIRYALAYTAVNTGEDRCDDLLGYGIPQVQDALDFLKKYDCLDPDANWAQSVTFDGSGCTTIDVEPDPQFSVWKRNEANTQQAQQVTHTATTVIQGRRKRERTLPDPVKVSAQEKRKRRKEKQAKMAELAADAVREKFSIARNSD